MAGNNITISTEQVNGIANQMSQKNEQLNEELIRCKNVVDKLQDVWQGQASEATIQAFNSFANDYFANYKQCIEDYVNFLRNVVNVNYAEVEKTNMNVAEAFK